MDPLEAISPVDGRYRKITEPLAACFSEYAIIRYRILVEIEYFIALCRLGLPQLSKVNPKDCSKLRAIYRHFKPAHAERVKELERETNHDVKAVEYFLQEQFDHLGLGHFKAFIHLGLTSQDINNTSFPLALRNAWREIMEPLLEEIYQVLLEKSNQWKQVPMLARTHGQPASPTMLGKEFYVFVERLGMQRRSELDYDDPRYDPPWRRAIVYTVTAEEWARRDG